MTTASGPAIVVGIDGSEQSSSAVDWAAREAVVRSLPLRVVHAWSVPIPPVAMGPAVMRPDDSLLRDAAQTVLDEAVSQVQAKHPEANVVADLQPGPPATVLLEAAESASVLVVGSNGVAALSELLLGSISMQCVTHAKCPVVVVPHTTDAPENDGQPRRIIAGIDGSDLSVAVAEAAFDEAAFRRVGLTLLHVMDGPAIDPAGMTLPNELVGEDAEQAERLDLAETVAGLSEKFPDVSVEERFAHGKAGKVLAELSRNAELMVVGSRGHGGLLRLVQGSTSHAVLQNTHCPVLVIRANTT
jgi:nucleotide-binding universal stress UspA family protein